MELYLDWIYSGLFSLALLLMLGLAEHLQKKHIWSPDTTRKMVHILTGVFIATTPWLFHSKWPMVLISSIFTITNLVAIWSGHLSGMHGTHRRSFGTVFYPISFIILLLFFWDRYQLILVISMLVLAFGDAFAALVGEKLARPHTFQLAGDQKSLEGSSVMFGVTVILVFVGLLGGALLFDSHFSLNWWQSLWIALIVGVVATVCEAISSYGSDNLTVPIGVALILHFMLSRLAAPNASENIQLTLGLVFALVIAATTYRLHFLSESGAVMTFLLGTVVFGMGGWQYSLPILAFFILSSLLSKLGKQEKKKLAQTFQKSSQRDMWQVLANGGLAGMVVLIWNYARVDWLFYLYLGSLSAVTADTWSTEIGFFSKKLPRSILNFKPVPHGTSGGLTLLGTTAGFLGAVVITLVGWFSASEMRIQFPTLVVISVAGLVGGFFDSLLGATVQAQFKCPHCHKITEKVNHCGNFRTEHVTGWRWMDNDLVNLGAAVMGVMFVWFLIWLFPAILL